MLSIENIILISTKTFYRLLLLIRRPKFTIPGSMLKHMSKEKRALARKEALEKETEKPNDDNL